MTRPTDQSGPLPKNRKVRPYRALTRRAPAPVLLDANVLIYLDAADYDNWERWERDDYDAFVLSFRAALRRDVVQIPKNVFGEALRKGMPDEEAHELSKFVVDDYPYDRVCAFTVRQQARMGPVNHSFVDVSLVVRAWEERKLIYSLDAWIVGKAQAMNTIHPALHDVAFEQDGPRVGAYTSWAGHAPPPREKP